MIIVENDLLSLYADLSMTSAMLHLTGNYFILNCLPDEFHEWCKAHDIKAAFYEYSFYEAEKYLVSDELIQQYTDGKKEYAFCKKWADRHNAEINIRLDFSRPRALYISTVFHNMAVVCSEKDKWMPEEILEAEDALLLFQEKHEDELLDMYEYSENNVNLMDLLTNQLLSDKNFRACTNQGMRRTYLEDFLNQPKNKKFLALCRGGKLYRDKEYRMSNLLDQIYNEYRRECYRLKVQVGDELPSRSEWRLNFSPISD